MCCPVPSRVWRKSHARGGVGRNVPLAVGLGLGEGQSIDRKLDILREVHQPDRGQTMFFCSNWVTNQNRGLSPKKK